MPHNDSNIPQNIFYSIIKEEFLKTIHSTLFLDYFIPKGKEPLNHMESQGSKRFPTKHAFGKITLSYEQDFQHFSISCLNTYYNN